MYRNRVDPEGQLHAVPDRLGWYGNRGCLHDDAGLIRRFHQGNRWITCALAFKGRRRQPLLPPNRYTGLFFLDEASAYAAGHRPCAECRRAAYERFRALWSATFAEDRVPQIDARLQAARMAGKARRVVTIASSAVPVGAMIRDAEGPLLRGVTGWYRWSFSGYRPVADRSGPDRSGPDSSGAVSLLTPEPVARLMAAGLPVQIHPSADLS